jgi:hypothetical protein
MRSTSRRRLVEPEPEEPAAASAGVAHVIEMWPLTRLRPYPRNARVHSPEQIAQIARSIEQWGFTIPVLVDESGMIIAGHGRVEAAKLLKMLEVPVIVAQGWSDAARPGRAPGLGWRPRPPARRAPGPPCGFSSPAAGI